MPDLGEPVILPRPDLTLHRAPPRPAPPRPAPPLIYPPLRKACEGRTPTSSFVGAYCTVPRPPSAHQGDALTPPPIMSARSHTSSRASDFLYSSTWCRDSRHTSTRSWESRKSSRRSQHSRLSSKRSRSSSLRDSIRSVASSAWQETARRGEPLRRVATPHVRSARVWAGRVRERVSSGGGAPLLTPGRHRRSQVVVEQQCDASPGSARNSHRVHATVWATSAARTLRWETSSGLAALVECGAAAGSAAAAGAERLCATATAMADAKLQQLRRSISNWSLSTVKKPKVTLPKLKKPKLKFLSGGRKNRVDPKDESVALDEVKAALLKAEGNETATGPGGEVIHNPSTSAEGGGETQPTIVLTVHHRNTPPDPPPPLPSPGLLAATNDLDFIDSDDPEADEGAAEAISPEIDYSDQWFDARGTLTRSKNNLDDAAGDYDDARMTRFYDAQGTQYCDDTDDGVELESNTYDPVNVTNSGVPVEEKGSIRAREWVKSFDEDAESRVQRWMKMQKNRNPSSLPKSKSEIRLDDVEDPAEAEKWANRDEIKLKTAGKNVTTNSSKDHDKKDKIKEKIQQRDTEKEKLARKESLKKIFQVRGKLSIKPIVDSLRPKYTDTDIYIASTPIALANNSADLCPSGNMDSLDVSEDGINCSSVDLDPCLDIKPGQGDEAKDEDQQRLPSSTTPEETQKGVKVDSEMRDGQSQMSNGSDVVADSGSVEIKRERFAPDQMKVEEPEHDVSTADYENLPVTAVSSSDRKVVSRDKSPPVTENKSAHQNNKQEPNIIKSEMAPQEKNSVEVIESTASLDTEVQETGQPSSEPQIETTKISTEDHAALAQKVDGEPPPDPSKSETKKKKIPGANIQKSIKNFAGSIFSQQTNGKAKKEGGGEDKRRWSRISPFTKDHIFKSSGKLKAEGETAETKSTEGETQEPPSNESKHNVMGTDEKADIKDATADTPDADTSTVDTKGLNGISDEVFNGEVTEPTPDGLCSDGGSNTKSMRVSPERLALIPTEGDEPKSISHESSPGMDTSFVEEDGLRLRKDALRAIQAMDNDETATHFYSFLSASEYQTPVNKVPQDSNFVTEPVSPQPATSFTKEASREPMGKSESTKNSEMGKSDKARDQVNTTPDVTQEITPMSDQSKTSEELQSDVSANDNNNSETENLQTTSSDTPTVSQETESERNITSPSVSASVTTSPDASKSSVVPPEVPKLKLAPALPVEGEEPPKPSPRLKKGRYGYSVNGTKRAPTSPPAPVSVLTKPENSTAKAENTAINGIASSDGTLSNTELATFPRRTQSKKKTPLVEHERISSDSGYVGPHTSSSNYYYGGNDTANSDTEPIYWEISETKDAPPRPSPRIKKGQPTPSDSSLQQTSPPRNGGTPSTLESNYETKQVPEWINNRAPIPSPRSRKQRSLQSLPTVAPPGDSLETVKRKLQLQSQTSPEGAILQEPEGVQAVEDDQFYSGKAASISYGFTPNSQCTASKPSVPPSPPLRGRKASQLSLPGAMMAEEMLNKKRNRRSVHEEKPDVNTRSNNSSQRPQYTNRARRRTDPTHGMSVRTIKSAMLRVGETVAGLTDLLVAVGLQQEASARKSEELLTDVLYSVQSLMGATGGGVWLLGGAGGSHTQPNSCVTIDQVKQVLQAAFQVTPDSMNRINQEVQSRPVPEVSLHLNLKEAKDLRPKTVKGTTNPYVTVTNPSTGQSNRTRLEKDTLNPKWNQEFTLKLKNLQKDVIHLEVWHEHDAVTVKQVTAVRDIRGLGRLMKGTTAQAQHQTSHLLGQISLNVKDVSHHGVKEDWYPLKKMGEEGQHRVGGDVSREKERGTLLVTASVSSLAAQLGKRDSRSYDCLLAHLIHHEVAATNNNNEQEEDWPKPQWSGKVTGPATAALAQFAITLELSDATVQLSWWRIGSQVSSADPDWILYQLHQVQAALGKGAYKGETLTELQASLASYVRNCTEMLKDLMGAFPPESGVQAPHNLKSTLKILLAMQSHMATRCLLDQEDFPHLQDVVSAALSEHTKRWWRSVIEEQLHGVKTADEQISKVINIVAEAHTFLTFVADFYNPVIMKEMNINYMQTAYLSVCSKINPCVRPLIMNIYNRMPTGGAQITEESDDGKYALEVGTSLWQLYRNLGRLHALGEHLPADLRAESGVREYHRWFSRGVMRWLELAVSRAQNMIMRAVELDNLEPVDSYFNFSSSATDTTGIFLDVKNWWVKLAWPDPENSAVLLTKILEDICSCGTKYSDLVREKVQLMLNQERSSRVFITKEICVGLNSIERVREELTKMPVHFGFEKLLEEVRQGESGSGAVAARQLEATVERLIFSAAENMESKVNEFVETVIDKMKTTLENAVNEACESQSPTPLLSHTLDPTLDLLQSHLNSSNFHRFLCRTWEVILQTFHSNAMRNAERRKPNYFGGVYNILEATLNFFSPGDGNGLDRQAAQNAEYTSLLELLESLRKTTESVICQYYRERYEEQVDEILPSKAQLVVKLLFTRPGKLIVEVIMARDMVVEGDTGSIGSSYRGHHHEPVDSYVKVQPVPAEWFPAIPIRKTKTLRKQDPAVYEETFEYEMSKTDDGVSEGFLLLTLKDYNLGRSNTFIGEAVVPLSSLPCKDSSEIYTVPNTYLKMTTPGLDIGYKSLRALQFRTGDRTATSFLKKVSKRLMDSKTKGNSPLKPEDEKAGSKSPAFRERLKFS